MSARLKAGIGSLEAVMFDLDGTLIDSIPTYFRIIAGMLDHVGLPPAPREAMSAALKSGFSGFHHLVPEEMSHRKEELVEAFLRVGKRISARLYPGSVTLIPGAKELFHRLVDAGIPIGIVSSSHAGYIERKLSPLKEAGLDSLVDTVITLEDTSEMKPSPEPVTTCAERLGAEAERSLFVGDADVDILAGKRAGTYTAGVLTGVDDYETLAAEDPDMILPGIRDLIPLF
ncbi:MAG: HAD family hydrolase [Deltaproteobacteria bacterium]|nr:HAD family hydrolase [Deltaproteobacteria bacterium]